MEKGRTRTMAHILRWVLTLTFVCNLAALPLVPGLVGINWSGGAETLRLLSESSGVPVFQVFALSCWQYLWRVWRIGPEAVVLALFLLLCGTCTAVILWQGLRVLKKVEAGRAFCAENARYAATAGTVCFVISALALARFLWAVCYYGSLQPLFSYNTLFIPVFLAAGLMLMVLSALIRQAAELKAENDLTI